MISQSSNLAIESAERAVRYNAFFIDRTFSIFADSHYNWRMDAYVDAPSAGEPDKMVEARRLELLTYCVQSSRSPN